MARHKVSVTVSEQGQARALSTALMEIVTPAADASTLFEQGTAWRVEAYFETEPNVEALHLALRESTAADVPELAIEPVPDLNWVTISQAALPPVTAGRFTVLGSHDRHRIADGPLRLVIDAGEAFGTAHHATTQGCLVAIDRLTRQRTFRTVLDLGCGTGVLAIAASRVLPKSAVTATDIDPLAVAVARDNIARNRARPRIRTAVQAGLPRGRYDLVIANILAAPLIRLARSMRAATEREGMVVLSGILMTQAAQVIAAYVSAGFALVRHERFAGWSTLTLVRR